MVLSDTRRSMTKLVQFTVEGKAGWEYLGNFLPLFLLNRLRPSTDFPGPRVSWGSCALRLGATGAQPGPCKGEGLSIVYVLSRTCSIILVQQYCNATCNPRSCLTWPCGFSGSPME